MRDWALIEHDLRRTLGPIQPIGQRVSDDALIGEIGRRLAEAAPGENGIGSDVGVLVIEPSMLDPIQESVRLRRALRGLGVAIDVLVYAREEQRAAPWSEAPL